VNGRKTWAGYIDAALDPVTGLHLDLAGRYEHYSDFGSVWTGKATARYDFSPAFALRGTVSNGFRAPTLAEEYYSVHQRQPQFDLCPACAQFAGRRSAGLWQAEARKSTNLSAGFVAHPGGSVQLTVDAYQIKITNRIVASGGIVGYSSGFGSNGVVSSAVLSTLVARGLISSTDPAAIASSGYSYFGLSLFTNGADTRTRGVEATLTATSHLGNGDRIDWNLGFNYNRTQVTRVAALPAAVYNAAFGQTTLLTRNAIDALTTATPRVKVIAGALISHGPLSLNLRETLYGITRQHVSLDGTGSGNTVIGTPTTLITDVNLGWKVTGLPPRSGRQQPAQPQGHHGAQRQQQRRVAPADGSNVYDQRSRPGHQRGLLLCPRDALVLIWPERNLR
jgi:iron complex outermembrane receptor protein